METIAKCLIFTRVSTDKQDTNRQISQLKAVAKRFDYEVAGIISEVISGATRNKRRPELLKAIEMAQKMKYSVFMVTELSRLGRSPIEVLSAVDQLHKLNINIYIDQFSMFTRHQNGEKNLMSELFISILSSFAQLERETIRERIKSGQAYAIKNKGVKIGRPRGSISVTKYLQKHKEIVNYTKKNMSIHETAKLTGKSHMTVSNVRKAMKAQRLSGRKL